MTAFFHLDTHRYQVFLPGSLSAGAGPREGVLLRVEWSPRLRGYADLMAWPELGDLSIEEEIQAILRGTPTRLGRRAIEMARLDAEARSQNRSLWNTIQEPPRSHWLAGSVFDLSSLDLARLSTLQFRAIKAKVSMNAAGSSSDDQASSLLAVLKRHLPELRRHDLRLRLDFNGSADLEGILNVLHSLEPQDLRTIEFLEDPLPIEDVDAWRHLKSRFPDLPLFVDRLTFTEQESASRERELLDLADGWVLKPALQELQWAERAAQARKPVTFTQYLGHAVGAAWAAWHAASAPQSTAQECGLLFDSRIAGESASFAEALKKSEGDAGAFFSTTVLRRGTGIGWSETDFDALSWSPWR